MGLAMQLYPARLRCDVVLVGDTRGDTCLARAFTGTRTPNKPDDRYAGAAGKLPGGPLSTGRSGTVAVVMQTSTKSVGIIEI